MANKTQDLIIKSGPFSGKRDEWNAWRIKFEAIVDAWGLRHHLYTKTDEDKEDDNIEGVRKVYRAIVLCMPSQILTLFASLDPFPEQKPGIKMRNTPHPSDCWTILLRDFEGNTLAHRRQLKMRLFRLNMASPVFNNDFQLFLAEINNVCNKLAVMGATVEDEDKLCVLIGGLPKSAEHAVSFIDTQEDFSFTKASDYLTNFFARQKVNKEAETDVDQPAVYMVTGGDSSKPVRFCTHCKIPGHTTNVCFKLHPELLANAPKCNNCGKVGHTAKRCKARAKESDKAADQGEHQQAKTTNAFPLVHFLEDLN